MKQFGYILIAIGLALLVFVLYSFFQNRNRLHSPIPEEKGVKVIFITPTK
jgi:hypothetical protein